MSENDRTEGVDGLRFRLSLRSADNDRVAILLHFYEGQQLAKTKVIGAARPSMAKLMLLGCRLHLLERGLREYSADLPQAPQLEPVQRAA